MNSQQQFLAIKEVAFFASNPIAQDLKSKLLALGGTTVVWREEPHLSVLVEQGHVFDLESKMTYGAAGQCHANVARLFMLEDDIKIATGYALSDDGLWRQHSWGIKDETILETTVKREKYFGIIWSKMTITEFVFAQLGDELMRKPYFDLLGRLPMPEKQG